jgi:drug/metabolite transporter (DMT)-like permease
LVIETFVARYFLGERVGWLRWMGAALVAAGVSLLAA